MISEITKVCDDRWLRGWLLYDDACPSCCRFAALLEKCLTRRGFDLAPLQAPWVSECLGLAETDLLTAVRLVTIDGHVYSGADAILFLARRIWWAFPILLVGSTSAGKALLRRAYAFWAAQRCRGACLRPQGGSPAAATRT